MKPYIFILGLSIFVSVSLLVWMSNRSTSVDEYSEPEYSDILPTEMSTIDEAKIWAGDERN